MSASKMKDARGYATTCVPSGNR